MSERWLGILVASEEITAVDFEVPDSGPITLQADHTWPLQRGVRPDAYRVIHQHVADYVRENNIKRVVIKGSAVSLGGTSLSHLEAAELRGVIASAAASICKTEFIFKANTSKTFGSRKVDEYLKDSTFWSTQISGKPLRKGSREAAMVLLAARKKGK
jgi:hypothetical protein